MSFWDRRLSIVFGFALLAGLVGEGCAVRPVPEPPSVVDTHQMSLTSESSDSVALTGAAGALPAGNVLRVVNPTTGDRSQVRTGDEGEFDVVLRGVRSDVLFLELLDEGTDEFVAAVTGGTGTTVVSASSGGDQDQDGSPDAIDCAPTDKAIGGSQCAGPACSTDADCAAYQRCEVGTCVTDSAACEPSAEICDNGFDEDCDGVIDDGCVTSTACGAGTDCPAGQTCVGGTCVVCMPSTEICNGLDDDCDGLIDEDC